MSNNFYAFQYTPAETEWNDFDGNTAIIEKEMNKREPFTSVFYNSHDESSIGQNVNTIKEVQDDINSKKAAILQNYVDISNNIGTYMDTAYYLSSNDNVYHYTDIMDPNVIITQKNPADIKMKVNSDINEIKLYQNSVYITSAIACATLIIAAIMIIPSKSK
jgi:hypothetical protein